MNLKTNRLQKMINWYRLVFGMTVIYQYESGAWWPTTRPTTGDTWRALTTRNARRLFPRLADHA